GGPLARRRARFLLRPGGGGDGGRAGAAAPAPSEAALGIQGPAGHALPRLLGGPAPGGALPPPVPASRGSDPVAAAPRPGPRCDRRSGSRAPLLGGLQRERAGVPARAPGALRAVGAAGAGGESGRRVRAS